MPIYVNNMIKHIDYNGTKVPYSVGYYALKRFKGETKREFEDIKSDELEDLEILMWFAIEAGCKIEKIENPVNRDEMEIVLELHMMEILESIPDFFQIPPTSKIPPTGGTREKKQNQSSDSKKEEPKKKS